MAAIREKKGSPLKVCRRGSTSSKDGDAIQWARRAGNWYLRGEPELRHTASIEEDGEQIAHVTLSVYAHDYRVDGHPMHVSVEAVGAVLVMSQWLYVNCSVLASDDARYNDIAKAMFLEAEAAYEAVMEADAEVQRLMQLEEPAAQQQEPGESDDQKKMLH